MNYKSTGTLRYFTTDGGSRWIRLMCCGDLARYYRTQIHDSALMLPMWGPHITVCNGRWEKIKPDFDRYWRKYDKKRIDFTYEGKVQYDSPFYFLFCFSERLGDIREELGLSRIFAKRPLHFTLGRNTPSNKTKVV